jgi:hypothetical protein
MAIGIDRVHGLSSGYEIEIAHCFHDTDIVAGIACVNPRDGSPPALQPAMSRGAVNERESLARVSAEKTTAGRLIFPDG